MHMTSIAKVGAGIDTAEFLRLQIATPTPQYHTGQYGFSKLNPDALETARIYVDLSYAFMSPLLRRCRSNGHNVSSGSTADPTTSSRGIQE
jgi:hypothetical protein